MKRVFTITMPEKKVRMVRLLEPRLCTTCRFADIEEKKLTTGDRQRVVHCRRLDCDNWEVLAIDDLERILSSDGSD